MPPAQDDSDRTAVALHFWHSAVPALGTPAEIYLRSRGIDLAVPPSIRFHPRLKYPAGGVWPGMVAFVTRGTDGQPMAVHRTFLARNRAGKAPASPSWTPQGGPPGLRCQPPVCAH